MKSCGERGIEAVIPDSQERKGYNEEGQKMYEAADFIDERSEVAAVLART